jgi:hypothetical protein
MSINISETQIIEGLIDKLNIVSNNLNKIKDYTNITDNIKSNEYLEELNKFCLLIDDLEASSGDIVNKYIMNVDTNLLSFEDKLKKKRMLIDKKIQDIFLPYMIYMQIYMNSNNINL